CLALIKQIIVQLAITIDLAAVLPCLPDQFGLTDIFLCPFTQRVLEPCIKATGMDVQATTHRADRKNRAMLGDKCVSHFASLAERSDRRSNTRSLFLICRAPR